MTKTTTTAESAEQQKGNRAYRRAAEHGNTTAPKPDRIIRKPELLNKVGLSDVTIWRMEKDGKFPKRLRLGGNSCGWLESEIDGWVDELAAARN